MQESCILSELPLVSARGHSTTIRFLLQCGVHYDLVLGAAKLTDEVAVFLAVMSQQSSLVNCADYIQLVSQQHDVI